jgi:hypothetical protein
LVYTIENYCDERLRLATAAVAGSGPIGYADAPRRRSGLDRLLAYAK